MGSVFAGITELNVFAHNYLESPALRNGNML